MNVPRSPLVSPAPFSLPFTASMILVVSSRRHLSLSHASIFMAAVDGRSLAFLFDWSHAILGQSMQEDINGMSGSSDTGLRFGFVLGYNCVLCSVIYRVLAMQQR